jgi:S-adenosylmethionine:tRNA ribosyltransferase-isomerase
MVCGIETILLKTELFDFHLPEQLIAQEPLPEREASRMLVLNRASKTWQDSHTRDLPSFLRAGDVLILNDTRVIPARLRSLRDTSGGKVEILLLPPEVSTPQATEPGVVRRRVLIKAGGKLKIGESFTLIGGCKVVLRERLREAGDIVDFFCSQQEFDAYVQNHGEVPLPPYIRRSEGPSSNFDKTRYQTVYAHTSGAVAAPTAGLHFSEQLLQTLSEQGIERHYLTLHVGPGTFRPVKADLVEEHFVDPEPFIIPEQTVDAVLRARRDKRRVVAVGTTSIRALEGALGPVLARGEIPKGPLVGETKLFVHPPHTFQVADALLTNFHIPKSSLLMLITAFAAPGSDSGIEFVKSAYQHAVASGYRFYSYGDACLFV